MTARSTDEPHRVSSQLELLFDLTFVIAVAALAHHFAVAIGRGSALGELIPFLEVFFAIWWAWVNFTWFASAFDTDDVPFRLLTLVQMAGVLVLAAGVPSALDHGDWRAVTIGYAIMRIGLVSHWLRAAIDDPSSRETALRYAAGITLAEVLWLSRLAVDEAGLLGDTSRVVVFLALVALELCIPVWAEQRRATSWHPHHIAERYGLFAIILFGESVFAASTGVDRALSADGFSLPLVAIGAAALVLVFALWWLYFLQPAGEGLVAHRERSYVWGYGHYGLLAALAAIGAGLEIAVEQVGHPPGAIGWAIAIPVAAFIALTWALHAPLMPRPVLRPGLVLAGCAAVLLVPTLQVSVVAMLVLIAVVCAAVVALTLAFERTPALALEAA
ncbi:low temperature requirement protein A [Solirubrobacter soli]|uniref:low temperature requirement protein A n=1 Tax=Solirubrobacter soli TaxID=363832 RepID=UPI00041ABA10|nr:low temperature requirement protein A [Solirubrobacter soli]